MKIRKKKQWNENKQESRGWYVKKKKINGMK